MFLRHGIVMLLRHGVIMFLPRRSPCSFLTGRKSASAHPKPGYDFLSIVEIMYTKICGGGVTGRDSDAVVRRGGHTPQEKPAPWKSQGAAPSVVWLRRKLTACAVRTLRCEGRAAHPLSERRSVDDCAPPEPVLT